MRALATRQFRLQVNRLRRSLSEALKRRFALRLTMEGWCLVVTMLLIGLAALNTAAPLLYLMFSMMCAFFVLSAMLATNTIRRLDVRRDIPRTWAAGTPLRVKLQIRNRKLFTSSYSLRVYDRLAGGFILGAAFFDFLPPRRGIISQEYECVFRRRGVYHLQRIDVATRFPFGLIERVLSFSKPLSILVLPQTISVSRRLEQARVDLGDYESHQKGRGSGLYGLRDYSADFPARDIHWKLSARRGNLVVREYESEERRRSIVVLDNRIPREEQADMFERFEKAVVLAASVVEWLCQTQHDVELRTASGVVGFGTGPAHVSRCRRALARLQMVDPEEGDERLLRGGEADIVLFPILLRGEEQNRALHFPLSVDEFEQDLKRAFELEEDSGEESSLVFPMTEAAARV